MCNVCKCIECKAEASNGIPEKKVYLGVPVARQRWREANSCPVESVSILTAALCSSWPHCSYMITAGGEEEMHQHLYIPRSAPTHPPPPPADIFLLWIKKKQSGWEQSSCESASRGQASPSLSSPLLQELQRGDGYPISLLLWRRLTAVFGSWMTSWCCLTSVLHVSSESARLKSLMQTVLLAGRSPQGSRRVELRVGEAQRLSPVGSRQRPAAADWASVFNARLGLQLSLAQLQQWRYLLPQRQGFEPATCQEEKGFHKRL